MVSFLLKRTERSKYESSAGALLQEGMEVSYNVLLSQWNCCTTTGSYKITRFVSGSNTQWKLSLGEESNIETRFSRQILIRDVCRDGTHSVIPRNSDGSCSGTTSDDARVITTKITWDESGVAKQLISDLLVVKEQISSSP
jgi:hypothetical protein